MAYSLWSNARLEQRSILAIEFMGMCPHFCQVIYLISIHLAVYLSMYPSVYLSMYRLVYRSIHLYT